MSPKYEIVHVPGDEAVPSGSADVFEIVIPVSAPFQVVTASNSSGAGVVFLGVLRVSGGMLHVLLVAPSTV